MTAFARSIDQRMAALHLANTVRADRAALKRQLKAGTVSVRDVVLEPPPVVDTMKVFDVLLATPKYGRVKAAKILQLCRISPSKTVGGLTARQRTELASMLRSRTYLAGQARTSMGTDPDAQHMRALRAANNTRLDRAELRHAVASNQTTVAAVLRDIPDAAVTMPIGELIMSQHRWGRTRTRRFLAAVPILETKPVGLLTERQRNEITRRLSELSA